MLGLMAVMERSSVLRVDGGRRAPGRGRSGRFSSLSDLASSFVPHARLFSLHPRLVAESSCGSHGVGAMISCGSMHGVVMHDNSPGMHVNSGMRWGTNSCNLHAAGVQGGTKALSTSTRLGFGRPAVEKLASQQQVTKVAC